MDAVANDCQEEARCTQQTCTERAHRTSGYDSFPHRVVLPSPRCRPRLRAVLLFGGCRGGAALAARLPLLRLLQVLGYLVLPYTMLTSVSNLPIYL